MPRATAFGADATGSGDQGQIIAPPMPGLDAMRQMARDIAIIRERYDQPQILEPIPLTLAAGVAVKVDRSQTLTNAFVMSVISGEVNFWFGDFVSGSASGVTPHMRFTAVGAPITVPIPIGGYVFTVGAPTGGAAIFTFIPMAL